MLTSLVSSETPSLREHSRLSEGSNAGDGNTERMISIEELRASQDAVSAIDAGTRAARHAGSQQAIAATLVSSAITLT